MVPLAPSRIWSVALGPNGCYNIHSLCTGRAILRMGITESTVVSLRTWSKFGWFRGTKLLGNLRMLFGLSHWRWHNSREIHTCHSSTLESAGNLMHKWRKYSTLSQNGRPLKVFFAEKGLGRQPPSVVATGCEPQKWRGILPSQAVSIHLMRRCHFQRTWFFLILSPFPFCLGNRCMMHMATVKLVDQETAAIFVLSDVLTLGSRPVVVWCFRAVSYRKVGGQDDHSRHSTRRLCISYGKMIPSYLTGPIYFIIDGFLGTILSPKIDASSRNSHNLPRFSWGHGPNFRTDPVSSTVRRASS